MNAMNATRPLRFSVLDTPSVGPRPAVVDQRAPLFVRSAILTARNWLLDQQNADGAWCGRRQLGPAITARLLLLWRRQEDAEKEALAGRFTDELIRQQRDGGGWSCLPGGPMDLSASVLCYLAIKLRLGADALPELRAAANAIRQAGGAGAADAETLAWLALFGQVERSASGDNAGEGANSTVVNSALAEAEVCRVSSLCGVRELFVLGGEERTRPSAEPLDEAAELVWRKIAGQEVDEQIQQRIDPELGFTTLGSAVVDTSQAIGALLSSGLDRHALPIHRGVERLLTLVNGSTGTQEKAAALAALNQYLVKCEKCDELPPSLSVSHEESWSAEEFRADELLREVEQAAEQLSKYLIAEVDADGSWGQCPRLTAEAVVALGATETDEFRTVVQRAVEWLTREQALDGSWRCAASDCFVEVTAKAIHAIRSTEADGDSDAVLAGVNWLLFQQKDCGGWGSQASPPTASQSAFALRALSHAGFASHAASTAGAEMLVDSQDEFGGWQETPSSDADEGGVDTPNSQLPSAINCLSALSSWASAGPASPAAAARPVCLRLAVVGTVEDHLTPA